MNLDIFNDEMSKIASQRGLISRALGRVDDVIARSGRAAQSATGDAIEDAAQNALKRPSIGTTLKFSVGGSAVGALRGHKAFRKQEEEDRRLLDMGIMSKQVYQKRRDRRIMQLGAQAATGAAVGGAIPHAWKGILGAVKRDLVDAAVNPTVNNAMKELDRVGKNQQKILFRNLEEQRKLLADDIQDRLEDSAKKIGDDINDSIGRGWAEMQHEGGWLGRAIAGKPKPPYSHPRKPTRGERFKAWARGNPIKTAQVEGIPDMRRPASMSEKDWKTVASLLGGIAAAGGTAAAMRKGVGMKLPHALATGAVAGGATGVALHALQGGFSDAPNKRRGKRRLVASRKPADGGLAEGDDRHRSQVSSRLVLPAGLQRRAEAMAVQGRGDRDSDRYFGGEDDRYRYGGKASGTRSFQRGSLLSGSEP